MLSDLFLGAFAFTFFFKHHRSSRAWSLFFLFMGSSALFGGIYHGYPSLGENLRFFSWSLLSAAMVAGPLAAFPTMKHPVIKAIIFLKSMIFLYLSVQSSNFSYMVVDTAISMLGYIVIGNALYFKTLPTKISYGILISIASTLFVALKISFHQLYMTYNDIGHYITILSLYYISQGVSAITSPKTAEAKRVS